MSEVCALLAKQIKEIGSLRTLTRNSPNFKAWKYLTSQIITKIWGANSPQIERFNSIRYSPSSYLSGTSSLVFYKAFKDGLIEAEAILKNFIKEIDIFGLESESRTRVLTVSKDIFIVHGSDHNPVKDLKLMLYGFGLNPIVLHEQASGGSTTIAEKLEKYSENVGYAFVILTPDDVGCSEKEIPIARVLRGRILKRPIIITDQERQQLFALKPRARQNVVFEMGYFWGLLNRKKVCCLIKGNVDTPSDIDGIVYVLFKDSVNECRDEIIRELESAGYETMRTH